MHTHIHVCACVCVCERVRASHVYAPDRGINISCVCVCESLGDMLRILFPFSTLGCVAAAYGVTHTLTAGDRTAGRARTAAATKPPQSAPIHLCNKRRARQAAADPYIFMRHVFEPTCYCCSVLVKNIMI